MLNYVSICIRILVQRYWRSLGLNSLAKKFLQRFLLGGAFPYTIGRIEHGFNVRPDLCATDNKNNPRKYLGSFYTDSLVHDPIALQLLIDVIGKVGFYFFESYF